MSRIGIMLRGVLRWLGERLPRRIGALLKPRTPAHPAPMTMAESREQALAAWEQLVSKHAPQLLRESAHERHQETTLQWPRLKPFGSSRQRGWPAGPGENMPAPACAPQHREACTPEPSRGPSFKDPMPAEQAGITRPFYHPNPHPASALGHSGWRKPVTTESASVQARHMEWTTESTAGRGHSPETATPACNPGACERMASPTRETAANKRGYGAPMPEPPLSYQRGMSKEATEPGTDPQNRASAWPDIPIPEANRPVFEHCAPETLPAHTRDNPWPGLPASSWSSPAEGPRPEWTEANRRQRLFDEQRGVL